MILSSSVSSSRRPTSQKKPNIQEDIEHNIAQETETKPKKKYAKWYDQHAQDRSFEEGDYVLCSLQLDAQNWRHATQVTKSISITYEYSTHDRRKKTKIVDINMLKGWNTPSAQVLPIAVIGGSVQKDDGDIIIVEKSDETIIFGNNLTKNQADDARAILIKYKEVCCNVPSLSGRVKHKIRTGVHQPFKSVPYRIPQAFQDQVTELKTLYKPKNYEVI